MKLSNAGHSEFANALLIPLGGNIPFLRPVRAHERPQMTTVLRTYIDLRSCCRRLGSAG